MATYSAPAPTIDPHLRSFQLKRAMIASAIGTSIEWYDFFLYGVAAALVFPHLFFPESDQLVGTLLSFSTFLAGFIARPVGAALFGHYGDRVGRKSLLIITLVMMGLTTMGIGLVPGYHQIGIWGAVLLTIGRVLQGIAVGGEWSGSVLMAGEWSTPGRRGFATSFAQIGAPAGMVLANGCIALVAASMDDAQFLSWGWRIPFLASVVLLGVGFYIRVGILESPVFAKLKISGKVEKAPGLLALRQYWREILLSALLRTGQHVPYYTFTTYILSYGTQVLGLSRTTLLNLVMAQSFASMLTIPIFGHLSDRYGRRRITAIGCVLMLIFPFVYFWSLDTRLLCAVIAVIIVSGPIHDLQYAPQATLIAESFPGSVRYSGSAYGYQLASVTAGGPAPIVATLLYQRYENSMAIAAYIAVSALISLIALSLMKHDAGSLDEK